MTTRMVLVPGYWLGAWAWDDVLPHLPTSIDAAPLTLPHDSLQAQTDAIITALDNPADRRILVVHSGSANCGTMALDQRPDLIDRMVFVDTAPPIDALAMNPAATDDFTMEDMLADPAEKDSFRDLTDEQLAEFRRRAVPEPPSIVADAVQLFNENRFTTPITVVCSTYSWKEFKEWADKGTPFLKSLNDFRDVEWIDLPTGHWPMWSKPEELAEILSEV